MNLTPSRGALAVPIAARRAAGKAIMRGFGELEAAIMNVLWDGSEPASVREIRAGLRPDREPAYNTVLTVVDILYKKGWLRRSRDGRAFRYRPVNTRAEYGTRLMRDAMAESGDPAGSLVNFVRQLNPDESAALREALQAYEREAGTG